MIFLIALISLISFLLGFVINLISLPFILEHIGKHPTPILAVCQISVSSRGCSCRQVCQYQRPTLLLSKHAS